MIPYLIEQHSQGNFPIEKIVQTYSIEDFALALEDMKSGKIIKPVLTWRC
jgi:Zn-dependent alcohol dehydrogenase